MRILNKRSYGVTAFTGPQFSLLKFLRCRLYAGHRYENCSGVYGPFPKIYDQLDILHCVDCDLFINEEEAGHGGRSEDVRKAYLLWGRYQNVVSAEGIPGSVYLNNYPLATLITELSELLGTKDSI